MSVPDAEDGHAPTQSGRSADFRVLAELSTDGMAILDAQGALEHLNPAGATILGVRVDDVLGRPGLLLEAQDSGVGPTRISIPTVRGSRSVDVVQTHTGDHTFIAFRDRTDELRRESHFRAFVQTAALIAAPQDGVSLLDDIADSVLQATGEPSCTLVLFDQRRGKVGRVGTAGGYPDDYAERLAGCVRLGAPLASLGAFTSQAPLVAHDWRNRVLSDDRWSPVHDILRSQDWGSLVAVPLTFRSRTLGSITLFFRSGHEPTAEDIAFLSAIGEMAALAIVNHELVARTAQESALEERHRIARDLHDSVAQTMFGVSLRARALQLAVLREGAMPEGIADDLGQLNQLATAALADARELIHHLRPESLEQEGLLGLVQRHAGLLSDQYDVEITVSSQIAEFTLSSSDQLMVLRIVQEAMANAARHSGADLIEVSFVRTVDAIEATVVDNGHGFDPAGSPPGHYGLEIMAERADSLGAELTINSAPGRTMVRVRLPQQEGPVSR